MSHNPTLLGLQASLQRLEDNIKAARDSVNLEVQRIRACQNHRVFYRQQLARCKQQHIELIAESCFLGQFICMNGDEIRAVEQRMIDLERSLRLERRNERVADRKIGSIQQEILDLQDEYTTIKETIDSLQRAETVTGSLELDIMHSVTVEDMMELDDFMECECEDMDESVLDKEIDYKILGMANWVFGWKIDQVEGVYCTLDEHWWGGTWDTCTDNPMLMIFHRVFLKVTYVVVSSR